jgi:hypothetical protein
MAERSEAMCCEPAREALGDAKDAVKHVRIEH